MHIIFTVGKYELTNTVSELSSPRGLAICDNGDIVTAEFDSNCVTIVPKLEGKSRIEFEGFFGPRGIALSRDGHILVTEDHQLHKLTLKGECVKSVGNCEKGSGQQEFNFPKGVAVDRATGHIFVADSLNNRVQVFTANLAFSKSIGIIKNEQLKHPFDVAVDNDGILYIAERSNHCITKVTQSGEFLARFGSHGFAPGQLSHPTALTVKENIIYIAELASGRLSIFNTNGEFLECFGKKDGSPWPFQRPLGIATDKFGRLYVSDSDLNLIYVLTCD